MRDAELGYAVLITTGLLLNGLAVGLSAPLRDLLAPLREWRLLAGVLVVDLLVVPAGLLVPAAVAGAEPAVTAGLVLLAGASTGAIGVALTRIGRGDVPVAVSIITALGAANLVTVPLLMAVLLPEAVTVPIDAVGRSLLVLLVLPLVAGTQLRRLLERRRRHPEAVARTARRLGSASTFVIAAALVTGFAIDPRGILGALGGVPALSGVTMVVAAGLAASALSRSGRRRRALWLTMTARAVGVAVAVAALHLPGADTTRATVLAVGGLTQLLPILLVLSHDRWARLRRRGPGPTRGRLGGTEVVRWTSAPDPAP